MSIPDKENLVHNGISCLIWVNSFGASDIGVICPFLKIGKLTWSTGHFMA